MRTKVTSVTSIINELESLMTFKILTQQDWKIFKNQFVALFPKFFIQLKLKNIHFTASEERLLALEYIHLNNREIANKLGISERSVIVSRHRLRKKIGAPKNLPILDFLKID